MEERDYHLKELREFKFIDDMHLRPESKFVERSRIKPLSYDELMETFKKVTYKPNWKMFLDYHPFQCSLNFRVETFCPYKKRKEIINFNFNSEERFYSHYEFLRFLAMHIVRVERHEVREMFKVDGKHFELPHPNGQNIF